MRFTFFKNTLLLCVLVCFSCGSQTKDSNEATDDSIVIHDTVAVDNIAENLLRTGAEQPTNYLPFLTGKNVGVVANQTSILRFAESVNPPNAELQAIQKDQHLVDFLVGNDIAVRKVFAPEHGFRGTADAGELVKDGIDTKTGLPIISLYGNNKKPSSKQLEGIEIMIFDIQDVGARFYTYISSLHYVMEACAEAGIPVLVFDRPNPNGHYFDGPILEPEHSSFVGMHPVPVVHGMTIGEYAQMINGEGWLSNGLQCELTVIKMENYTHDTAYSLPVKPSPNLPNDTAINLYPSLCFFEGTVVSAGRGTDMQFQIFGAPALPKAYFPFQFTPQANEGATYPKFKGEQCNGLDLRDSKRLNKLNLEWLIEAYVGFGKKPEFFNPFFTKLAGTKKLQEQIEQGYTYPEIRATWLRDLETYDTMRQAYLLYP
ncbi:MAG: DUF1343 domain-containing protein [Flavobacteriales bacterium]|jgi:uncharacterized protein YbbC (DUF1343 family)|nr:DUF1343 domain-containing protein [Flavobacteriales bacterium]